MIRARAAPAWDRLTLGDLLALVACMAAGMAATLAGQSSRSRSLAEQGVFLVVGLILGGLLTGPVLYLLRRRRQDAPVVTWGEALWTANAVVFWVPILVALVFQLRSQEPPSWWGGVVSVWVVSLLFTQFGTLILVPGFLLETYQVKPDPRTCWRRHRLGLYVCATLLLLEGRVIPS